MENTNSDASYYATYGIQTMPEPQQKRINRLCWVLLVLDIFVVLLWLLQLFRIFPPSLDFIRIIYYSAAILTSIVYCYIRILLFNFYYIKWFSKLHQKRILQASQIIGGIITVLTFLVFCSTLQQHIGGIFLYLFFIPMVVIVLLYNVVIPRLKQKRQAQVLNSSKNGTYSTPQVPVYQSSAEYPPTRLVDAQQELLFSIATLCGAIVCDIWACYVTIGLATALHSDVPSVKGMTGLVGLVFCAPLIFGMIAVCILARSRIRRIRLYKKQEACKSAIILNRIAIVLSLLPVIALVALIWMTVDQIFIK